MGGYQSTSGFVGRRSILRTDSMSSGTRKLRGVERRAQAGSLGCEQMGRGGTALVRALPPRAGGSFLVDGGRELLVRQPLGFDVARRLRRLALLVGHDAQALVRREAGAGGNQTPH